MERITKNCKRCGCISSKIKFYKDKTEIRMHSDPKGNIVYTIVDYDRYTCECPKCGYMVKSYGTIIKAIDLWNYVNRNEGVKNYE